MADYFFYTLFILYVNMRGSEIFRKTINFSLHRVGIDVSHPKMESLLTSKSMGLYGTARLMIRVVVLGINNIERILFTPGML